MNLYRYRIALILTTITLLQGCMGAVLVGGAAATGAVIHDRRSAEASMDDTAIEFRLANLASEDQDLLDHTHVSATSFNRVLLLTGEAESDVYRARYLALARQVPKVKRIVDEIQIGPEATLSQVSNDSYITSRVKLALFDVQLEDFDPSRVKVVTELGVVYLMGLVTRAEADAVVEKVRYVPGVQRVVKVFEYL